MKQTYNVDQLVREVYDALYVQLKRNETETNLSYLQSDIDVIVDRKISDGYMMNGTEIKVVESEINPYESKFNCIFLKQTYFIFIFFFILFKHVLILF